MWIVFILEAIQSPFAHSEDDDDIRWVKKTLSGNQTAFNKLVQKYQRPVYFLVRKLGLDHDNADDVVQETFVKAYTKLSQFNPDFPFFPWLHRIAINTTINRQKQIARQTGDEFSESNTECATAENPLQHIIHNELQRHITSAIDKLPMEQRVVFMLRTNDEMSYQDISEYLDISIGTVMSRLSRAREKLKILLAPYLNNDELRGEP
ncbi:sigma-70 family RNA polymerase sigma factor [candidate division KSB1 bacterium]|nr:sigma-70 family RNA polymerase sigma factor [candidate division KSB1 bacterium]